MEKRFCFGYTLHVYWNWHVLVCYVMFFEQVYFTYPPLICSDIPISLFLSSLSYHLGVSSVFYNNLFCLCIKLPGLFIPFFWTLSHGSDYPLPPMFTSWAPHFTSLLSATLVIQPRFRFQILVFPFQPFALFHVHFIILLNNSRVFLTPQFLNTHVLSISSTPLFVQDFNVPTGRLSSTFCHTANCCRSAHLSFTSLIVKFCRFPVKP